jgi:hypothetical protein
LVGAGVWGLDSGITGSLRICAKGGYEADLSGATQGSLDGWLKGSNYSLPSDLKSSVGGWRKGGAGDSVGGFARGKNLR